MRRTRSITKVATIFATLVVLLAPLVVAGLFVWQGNGPSGSARILEERDNFKLP